MNLAAISHRTISSNDQPSTQLLQQVCCSVSKNHQKTARSCNLNNILSDVISIEKSLKGITPEEHKHVFGNVRISDKSGNFKKKKKNIPISECIFEPDPFIVLAIYSLITKLDLAQ